MRHKIKTAYTNSCGTYEDLLDTVIAMEEELLHLSAASRLDYFGKGYKYENIVRAKRKQLDGTGVLATTDAATPTSSAR